MKTIFCVVAICINCMALNSAEPAPQSAALVEVRKIWDAAPHNAFTDLIRFKGQWFCVFREGQGHVYYALRLFYAPTELQNQSLNVGLEVYREYSVERGRG